jgi:hypothetical protein
MTLFQPKVPLSPPAFVDAGPREWWRYAESYRFAASTLVDFFARTGHDQDFLALPVLFLYRHYAELSLKLLVRDAFADLGRKIPKLIGHALVPLWAQLRPALEAIWPGEHDLDLGVIEAVVHELDSADPGSDTFRFPVDTKGLPQLPDYLRRLDVVHFAQSMEAYAHWVGGVADALSARSDISAELEREFSEGAPADW